MQSKRGKGVKVGEQRRVRDEKEKKDGGGKRFAEKRRGGKDKPAVYSP